MNSTPRTLVQIDTVLTADSVEWCPVDSVDQLLALGTYQLDETTRTRLGSLTLFSCNPQTTTLHPVAQEKTNILKQGVLDIKWNDGHACLALAGSDGRVTFLRVLQGAKSLDVTMLGSTSVSDDPYPLCLSLDWNKSLKGEEVAVSDSKGSISLIKLSESRSTVERCWKAHDFEAWIVVYGCDPWLVYSGGDDSRLCVWDTRTDCGRPSLVSRRHTMGVCSLQIHPTVGSLLASGSYDETLLLWDTRKMSKALKDTQLGGGIWRVKWNKHQPNLMATACMHNGFQLVNCHLDTSQPPEVVCQYNQHKSLAYGIDWCPFVDTSTCVSNVTLASCSFYDHSMHIWTTDIS